MIEFNEVSKVYDNGIVALNNITLRIEKGEFVFLIGPS
ncbi:MAG TPA: cell division ATP-binding protein FtsE, partial [Candidatus Wallbacteria bacterium]|nr:cell division ATP-binding protein FtsE [Candidatus Wallbacteria bacterium]